MSTNNFFHQVKFEYRKSTKDVESSDSSDGEDQPSSAKKSRAVCSSVAAEESFDFRNANLSPCTSFGSVSALARVGGDGLDVFKEKSKEFSKARKTEVVKQWQDIAEEGTVNDVAASLFKRGDVNPDEELQERGSEQYLNRRVRKRTFDEKEKKVDVKRPVYESDSELSSDGLSDDSLDFVRAKRGFDLRRNLRQKMYAVSETAALEDMKPKDIVVTFTNPGATKPVDTKETASTLTAAAGTASLSVSEEMEEGGGETGGKAKLVVIRRKRMESLRHRFKDLKDEDFADKLIFELKEKNKDMIVKAVTVLGQETCLKILHKTLKIRRRGGIMIKRGTRLRTIGGTFLYLIRNDKRVPAEKKEAVLQEQPPDNGTAQRMEVDRSKSNPNRFAQRIGRRVFAEARVGRGGVDLESEKFSTNFPGIPMATQSNIKEKEKAEGRKAITYDDIDF